MYSLRLAEITKKLHIYRSTVVNLKITFDRKIFKVFEVVSQSLKGKRKIIT